MEKERFLELARNYTSLTEAETKDLDALQKEFPYSQVIHNLASRGAQDNNLESYKKLLNISAVYSSDRSVLKDIITSPRTERSLEPGTIEQGPEQHSGTSAVETTSIVQVEIESDGIESLPDASAVLIIPTDHSDGAVADEILHDLERLQELKHNFEQSVEAFQHPKTTQSKSPVQKKKEDPIVVQHPAGEVLLEEIKTTKKKIAPESQKQKEQIEIIDQFIKKQPSIKKNTGTADAQDLAEKNFSLTDNVVSETLVEILLRQGKKDKAIEVLKKLIWKFPQKKAIFAAQIDELKK